MPHAGLMDSRESFDSAEGALLRARLHIRGARRRLRQGKIAAGIVTLYDALLFALRYYLMVPQHRNELAIEGPLDLANENEMVAALRQSRIIDNTFDLVEFEALVDRAAVEEMSDYDYRPVLGGFEALMGQLEVLPFDEDLLPAEDPSTF